MGPIIPRKLTPLEYKPSIRCSSNDYLGLSTHPDLIQILQEQAPQLGWGSTGSRLLSGDRQIWHELESQIATWLNKPRSLVFNSGYSLNVGVLSALFTHKDIIFADKYSHASLIDGAKLSGAKLIRFAHQDLDHLKTILKKYRSQFNKAVIVSESVFSMDGDITHIPDLIDLKHAFQTELYIDEAHALGVFGPRGEGIISSALSSEIDYQVGTFGKAFGSVGAYIACSESIQTQLIQSARSLIYSTALPPITAFVTLKALQIIQTQNLGKTLQDLTTWFRYELQTANIPTLGETHIIPILAGSEEKAVAWAKELANHDIDMPPIRFPTVPKNHARLRLSLTLNLSKTTLRKVISQLKNLK